MTHRTEMNQPMTYQTVGATWAATCIGWVATLIGFAITCGISVYGCQQSEQANRIANKALDQNEKLAAQNEAFQLRLKNFDQYLASPRLTILRFRKVSPSRYVLTIQNDGERQMAIFGASLHPSRVIGGKTAAPEPFVPETNRITAVEIPFKDANNLQVELPIPAIVHPGEILNVAITLADGSTEGDIYLDHSTGTPVHVGIYSMAPLPYPNAPSDTGLDDLFGR